MSYRNSTAYWVTNLRLQAHQAARKKLGELTVIIRRNVDGDDYIDGVLFPFYI